MAQYFAEASHTFNEYLLVPGYSSAACVPDSVSLRTPLVRYRRGEEPALSLNIPLTSAIMQSVSGDKLAVALSREGGLSFIYGAQTAAEEAARLGARALDQPGVAGMLDRLLSSLTGGAKSEVIEWLQRERDATDPD